VTSSKLRSIIYELSGCSDPVILTMTITAAEDLAMNGLMNNR
jgi:hypothetical protein